MADTKGKPDQGEGEQYTVQGQVDSDAQGQEQADSGTENQEQTDSAANKLDGVIQEKINRVVEGAGVQESLDKFAGIDEEEILKFVPDKRNFAGIGPILLGFLFMILLPGFLKWFSLLFFGFGILLFLFRYLNNAKVDVPDGYAGVICDKGTPKTGNEGSAAQGRNWHFNPACFIPYLVSQRDLVVDMKNANFTCDFGSICLTKQVVFKVKDPAKFISETTPAGIMKILNLYASYIALRMVTSMQDARVKFVGRDRIDNVVQALNEYLAEPYGIEVTRANMPSAENEIIQDLENLRTQLKTIETLNEDKQVKLESAIKEVESKMRKARKETRSKALELQQAKIAMETKIAEEVNTNRQGMLINARKELEEKVSSLKREIASMRSRIEKARAVQQSFHGLESQLDLRKAKIKRRIFQRMLPKHIEVMGVEGIGSGVGMSLGNRLFKTIQRASDDPEADPETDNNTSQEEQSEQDRS